MALEQERGISISSTVLQFPYRDCTVNLLDTPGHRDFSEDTYRVLAAADAAIMVLDVAKGIEPQTLKLFEVCHARRLPVLTFLNKLDRPGPVTPGAARRDRAADRPGADAGDLAGRRARRLPGRDRPARRRASSASSATGPGRRRPPPRSACSAAAAAAAELGDAWAPGRRGVRAARRGGRQPGSRDASWPARPARCSWARPSPTSACATSSTPSSTWPRARRRSPTSTGVAAALDAPFSGFVFKVQANMNPAHRDHVAFVRVCSGRFERGMVADPRADRPAVRHQVRAPSVFGAERDTIDEAWPGDVIGLVNASGLRVGDSLYSGRPVDLAVTYPAIPAFPPELIATAHPRDLSRSKQFKRGLAQLEQEGVVQILHRWGRRSDTRCWPRSGPCSSRSSRTGWRTSSAPPSSSAVPTSERCAAPTRPRPPPAAGPGRRRGAAPRRRRPAGRVREPVLAGPGGGRPPGLDPGADRHHVAAGPQQARRSGHRRRVFWAKETRGPSFAGVACRRRPCWARVALVRPAASLGGGCRPAAASLGRGCRPAAASLGGVACWRRLRWAGGVGRRRLRWRGCLLAAASLGRGCGGRRRLRWAGLPAGAGLAGPGCPPAPAAAATPLSPARPPA